MSDTEQVEAGPEQKRIYIGGLHDTITEESVRDRFQKFGTVSAVSIARDTEGKCRGFGHMSITTTPKDWSSCIASYNGAKWKGQTLRLEEAKEDYLEKKRKEQVKLIEREEKKRKRLARWNDSDGFMARDMTPVTDSNMKDRKGWKRGRYGRAIAVMRLRKDNGTTFVFEPTHYKNNLTKLYNIGGRMKTLRELPTRYEDYEDEDDHFDAQLAQNVSDEEMEDIESEGEGEGEAMTVEDKLVAKHEKDNAKRLAALERREEEQKARNEIMKRSFADMEEAKRTQHVSFESDGEENVPVAAKVVAEKPEAKDSKWMFDSDEDEDEEMEININPVLEGANGEQRLALQSKFKGDERFKLGEDFIDDGEADADGEEGDVITKELTEEKGQALDILKAMFGEQGVVKQKQVSQWSNSARFDPDAENAEDYIVKPKIEDKEDIGGQDENDDEDSSDQAQEDDKDYVRRPQSAMPVVSKEKHFEVNVNLKPLFSTQDEPFKMFGQESEGEEDEEEEEERELDESHLVLKNKEASAPVGLGLFFFFHMDDPGLLKKSCLTYDTHGLFQQQEDRQDRE
ncbi:hypothetical protein CLU79DRAFT_834641 [Phycomyces nitens]|nr:hypothetical protein CLU79DRAFT_834641 [Phycomyces nitens]